MDVAVLAGRVPHEDRLYAVGPFAERVSFASQQRRALSLVCAIDDDIRRSGDRSGLNGKRACVVGAGLAGLTCSAGLAAFGCDNWIVEAGREPLHRNRGAEHREIHPSINFWPREDVEVTTRLPFLNWYQDRCDRLLERLLGKWTFLERKHAPIKGVTVNCKVTGINWDGAGWRLEGGPTPPPPQTFDLVVFATGFGFENPLPGSDTPDYWDAEHDRIDVIRREPVPVVPECIVAGTGDGGLIEALRLLYRKFQAGKVNHGTSELLESEGLRRRLEAVEAKVRLRVSDEILRSGFPLSNAFKDEIALDLWSAYDAEFPDFGDSFRRVLTDQRSSVRRVVLVGERAWPTEQTAAPYHRLLLVHAIREGWIEYHQVNRGDLHVIGSAADASLFPRAASLDVPLKKVSFSSVRHIFAAGGATLIEDATEDHAFEAAFFLSRFTTTSPLEAILDPISPDLLPNVRKRQSLYADQDWISPEQANDLARRLGQPAPDRAEAWLDHALGDARVFFAERYQMEVSDDWGNGPPRFILYLKTGKAWADDLEAGPIPTSFFGVPVDKGDLYEIPVMSRGGH